MLSPFERIKIPPKVEEFISNQLKSLRKIRGLNKREREIRRLNHYLNSLRVYEEFILSFPSIDDLHPFYRESLSLIVSGDLNKVKKCLASIWNAVKIARSLLIKYINQIKYAVQQDPNILMRQGFGRASSVLRSVRNCIDWLVEVSKKTKQLKAIDPNLPIIIVSGPPNVGKSTLVSRISTAKPEIAHYPFTTKEIHVGHIKISDDILVQVIDTPGLLDRPMQERNIIEKKAINALSNLRGVIIFMIDVSKNSFYSSQEQINLLKEILNLNKPTIICLNKIDNIDEILYQEIAIKLRELRLNWFEISAEMKIGLDQVLKEALKLLGIVN
jgi:nucleolar GTP-binding protein